MVFLTLELIYVICALLLLIYAAASLLLLIIFWRHRHQQLHPPAIDQWPTVVIQLPIYNERYVVERLLCAVALLDYPRGLLTVQVLDDSTDDTPGVVAALVEHLRADGLNIVHVRREKRTGYKAGALAYGLSLVDSELVMVLDADFVPAPDFLRRTVPYLVANPNVGMVQTRWGHLNAYDNALTLGQTLALDGHFVVEQTARNRAGWLINFNGSGGVWRADCIREAGGWSDDTLTEDLELSYRAQLNGWRFLYLPDVVVPAELPQQMAAYKQQQARWAKGSTQTLLRTLIPVWRGRLTLGQRIMATMHLCQYMPHPLMLTLLLLTPPLMIGRELQDLPFQPLGMVGLGPPLIYVISQYMLYPDWWRRLLAFPVLLALGTGIAWNNTVAVIGGLLPGRKGEEFRRTPKFGAVGMGSPYALRIDRSMLVELGLALYATWGIWLAMRFNRALVPLLAVYSFAFGMVALWSLWDRVVMWQQAQLQSAG